MTETCYAGILRVEYYQLHTALHQDLCDLCLWSVTDQIKLECAS